jgi:hypothetical protein
MQKYGNPRYADALYVPFANYFRSYYAISWLRPVFTVLDSKSSGHFVADDVYRNCITYASNCAEMSPSYKVLKPHLDFLLFQIVFPTLCMSPTDIELFQDDPQEFIQKRHNSYDEWLEPREAASTLLQTLTRYRQKDVIPRLLPFIQSKRFTSFLSAC